MGRLPQALIVGCLTGVLGLSLAFLSMSAGIDLEESIGLSLLFKLRGPRPAPPEVVIVSTDKASADALGLPADPARWPRSLHAALTDTLVRGGAALIAFDLVFERASEHDGGFAEAIRRAGNVVLSGRLSRETAELPGRAGSRRGELRMEVFVPPVAALREAALASAPFPLPKVPVRVSQYWAFKAGAGDAPTLPVVAFQVFALDVYEDLLRLLASVSPSHVRELPPDRSALQDSKEPERVVRALRSAFGADPRLGSRLREALAGQGASGADTRKHRLLRALVRLYEGPDSYHLDFYGPPRTVTTIPFDRVLRLRGTSGAGEGRLELAGKAVFVGRSESRQVEQKDGFYTVFSDGGGLDLSGVEIAATAFANLLEERAVSSERVAGHPGLIFLSGLVLGVLAMVLPAASAAVAVMVVSLLYVVGALYEFKAAAGWAPVAMPVLVEAPLAVLAAVAWRYMEASRERSNIRKAFAYYLPERVVDDLARDTAVRPGGTLVYGTCLATDGERYTALAEALAPADLTAFMNRYYAAVFEPVRRHGGIVSDVVGDAAMAIWSTARPDASVRARACRAAWEIAGAVDRFNLSADPWQLRTRMGLHSGQMMLGNVGALDHYEYRAVGDIVNTAARIQGLNKRLGTRILLSDEVLTQVEGFLTRNVGTFLLAGKSRPVAIHELIYPLDESTAEQRALCALFAAALASYTRGAWAEARAAFSECAGRWNGDPPSRFYLSLCERYQESPPVEMWDGVVRLDAT